MSRAAPIACKRGETKDCTLKTPTHGRNDLKLCADDVQAWRNEGLHTQDPDLREELISRVAPIAPRRAAEKGSATAGFQIRSPGRRSTVYRTGSRTASVPRERPPRPDTSTASGRGEKTTASAPREWAPRPESGICTPTRPPRPTPHRPLAGVRHCIPYTWRRVTRKGVRVTRKGERDPSGWRDPKG